MITDASNDTDASDTVEAADAADTSGASPVAVAAVEDAPARASVEPGTAVVDGPSSDESPDGGRARCRAGAPPGRDAHASPLGEPSGRSAVRRRRHPARVGPRRAGHVRRGAGR